MASLGRDDANFPIALFFLILAMYCYGHSSGGTTVNPTDLAPPFSGAIFGMMNTFGAIPGMLIVNNNLNEITRQLLMKYFNFIWSGD